MNNMKKKLVAALIVPALGLPLALSAYAADSNMANTAKDSTASHDMLAQKLSQPDARASKLIGMDVKNAQNESLGDIKDLIVDLNNGRVDYAVLSFGGTLGMGNKLFAYPINKFQMSKDADKLVLLVDKNQLKNAPGFDPDKWPADWNNGDYRTQVDKYNHYKPQVANAHLVRASELIGKDVKGENGKNVGDVKDMVVNLGTGRIRYVALAFDNSWFDSGKLVPLPLSAFKLPADKNNDLTINVTKDQLKTAQAFPSDNWPNLNAPQYRKNLNHYLASFRHNANHRQAQNNAEMSGSTSSGK